MTARLYWQIHKLAFLLEKRADDALRQDLGIGFAQYKVLEAIHQNTLSRQNVVAKLLDQTEASVSRQIKILQKKGLIHTSDMMGDKRARELTLTRVGEEIVRQAIDVIEIAQSPIIEGFSYQEQQLFQDFFDRMVERARRADLL